MHFAAIVSTFLGLAACALAANITVQVAENGTLTFTPNSVNASNGDIIAFQFLAGNHTVTQSTFTDPCTKTTDGIDSGYQPAASGAASVPQYSFSVTNASSPLWFYCKQAKHCEAGMVFAVNPTPDKTYDAFKANAIGANSSSSSGGGSPSSTGSTSKPSSSTTSNSTGGALGFNPSGLAGIITLVAILAASLF